MTTAELGFAIRSEQAQKASDDLNRMVESSRRAEAAAASMGQAVQAALAPVAATLQKVERNTAKMVDGLKRTEPAANDVTRSFGQAELAMQRFIDRQTGVTRATTQWQGPLADVGAEMDRLRAKYNPLFAASKQYEAELNELNRAHRLGAITSQEHGAALVALNANYQMAAGGAQTYATSARFAQMQTRNLAFQVQDIGMMMAMGQNPFMLLAQQLPQVTMYGGRLNGIFGALRTTFAGLLSPLGLVTAGFVLAGSAAISYFASADDESEKVADALKEQETLIRKVADQWGDAIPAIREYADELDRLRNESELAASVQELTNRAWQQARDLLPDIKTEIGGIVNEMVRAGASSREIDGLRNAFNEADRAAQDLRTEISRGTQTTEDFDRVTDALVALLGNEAVRGSSALANAIDDLRDAYSAAADEAVRLGQATANALAIAAAQEANKGRFDKTGARLQPGAEPLSNAEFGSRFGWDNIIDFPKERKKRGGSSEAEKLADSYADIVREANQATDAFNRQRDALFMSEEAAAEMRHQAELLNRAQDAGINLTAQQTADLMGLGSAMAAAEIAYQKTKEALDFAKSTVKGFVSDLRSGLEQGKSFWESFGQAASNVLDKIIDKMLNNLIDAIFAVNRSAGGRGGGIFGGIFGWIGKLLGFARGGLFDAGQQVHAFANGGVVNRPTVFPFANGIGLMGEAGPEAIMPLRRGPNGRLGVEAANQNSRTPPQEVIVTIKGVFVDDNGVIKARIDHSERRATQAGAALGAKQIADNMPGLLANAQARDF
ncbi:phage tail length tape measure family protein [Mesorhizobium sp. Z1-4]|uniref:phage tail length tape measure family protein n=1 Tax=Mesorhizobium sp. Z1-4 TaxID=2448478 RepID=UPI000FD95296|nr:phage tail length tape measure family protein [Mesorhizobium sp. Z1-4]